jgi:hypothetical protein
VHPIVQIQPVFENSNSLRQAILSLPFVGGGTSMYAALSTVFRSLSHRDQSIESWVVCLTDGASDTSGYDEFRNQLLGSPSNHHLVIIGINLYEQYEANLSEACGKFGHAHSSGSGAKGFFVRADGTTAGMNRAFDVVKSRIPVSQTFARDGNMCDVECRQYICKFLPKFIDSNDMVLQTFWIRFLYRRIQIFDKNESFNYNDTYDNLGSSLMEIMLLEVERLLSEDQQNDWLGTNHTQLIYDLTIKEKPEFRLVCTAPDKLNQELREKLSTFKLPGFQIPNKADLDNRTSLDTFLSQALEIPMQSRGDGKKFLKCIDDHDFILTMDFTMKLLSIHERIACRVPCIMEGETGVSKTALTKMYSILRNSSQTAKAHERTLADLQDIEKNVLDEGFTLLEAPDVYERLCQSVRRNKNLAERVSLLIWQKVSFRSPLYCKYLGDSNDDSLSADVMLESFFASTLEKTFFEINVDASMTEDDFICRFDEINAVASRLKGSEATIVVFLDGTLKGCRTS